MKRCSRCQKHKDPGYFGFKVDGSEYSTCARCRKTQNEGRIKNGRPDREKNPLACIPPDARPYIRNIMGKHTNVKGQAYVKGAQNIWLLAQAQRNVPLCNFNNQWKPLIRIARSLA